MCVLESPGLAAHMKRTPNDRSEVVNWWHLHGVTRFSSRAFLRSTDTAALWSRQAL